MVGCLLSNPRSLHRAVLTGQRVENLHALHLTGAALGFIGGSQVTTPMCLLPASMNCTQHTSCTGDSHIHPVSGWPISAPPAGLPCELLRHFTPSQPLLVGGLTPAEEGSGFMQLRFKRHRWFPKIMKTRDPLIFSIGEQLQLAQMCALR